PHSYYSASAHLDVHSFPTRRSSDLLRATSRNIRERAIPISSAHRFHNILRPIEMLRTNSDHASPKTRLVSLISDDCCCQQPIYPDRKSTRLNSSHDQISYAVFCLKK